MIVKSRNNFYCFVLTVSVILFHGFYSYSQDTSLTKSTKKFNNAKIQWLCQWSSIENKTQKKEVKNQIKDFILGKKIRNVARPVSILPFDEKNFWILDQESNAVFQVINNVGNIPHFIEKKNKNFSSLVAICKFVDNQMLFTDSYSNKIFVINSQKKECSILNDSLKLNKTTGIAYSPITKEIWVIETGEHRIDILTEKGKLIKTIGSRGSMKGEFNFPTHIWIDKKGNAYVVDAMNFRVQVLNKEGEVISVFGSNGDASGYFASPKGIATDSYGHIYVADALFHVVQVFDIYGNFLYRFGSQGQEDGQFWMPAGIYIDDNDKIYVADSYNSRIQVFQLITGI